LGLIALLDYGVGNLQSVEKALGAAGAEVRRVTQPGEIHGADAVVVPGVGHFRATAVLGAEWRAALRTSAARGRPLLGICLGMQWFFEGSEEAPELEGLGLFPGRCTRLAAPRVPHVGWNSLEPRGDSPLLGGIPSGSQVYFTHSFAAPITDTCIASTDYGVPFASLSARGNVTGAQFHPEKSGDVGLRFLRNFIATIPRT
jgi:imidazole glycerol-phosphate synthase subunit HisH